MCVKGIIVNCCRMQMFLWNNIFLSLGFDVKDHFKDFGGDAAAYAAPVSLICCIVKLASGHRLNTHLPL